MTFSNLDLCYEHIELINKEQRRQIEIHKWIQSEKAGKDLSDEATLEWIEKYAPRWRAWAEALPYTCIGCGICRDETCSRLCEKPFDPQRIAVIEKGVLNVKSDGVPG